MATVFESRLKTGDKFSIEYTVSESEYGFIEIEQPTSFYDRECFNIKRYVAPPVKGNVIRSGISTYIVDGYYEGTMVVRHHGIATLIFWDKNRDYQIFD